MQNASASSDVFIKVALDQFQTSKESKKLATLRDAAKSASTAIEASAGHPNPSANTLKVIFEPFQLACQSRNPILVSISIDCLAKLFSYNYWGKPDDGGDEPDVDSDSTPTRKIDSVEVAKNELMSLVIDTICDSFSGGESTDDKVQLQIIKALSAAVCTPDPTSAIHGAILLRAIRTTYNVFLFSKSASTQIVAQATLSQMIQGVFGRIPMELSMQNKEEFLKDVDQIKSPTAPSIASNPLDNVYDEVSMKSAEPTSTEYPNLPESPVSETKENSKFSSPSNPYLQPVSEYSDIPLENDTNAGEIETPDSLNNSSHSHAEDLKGKIEVEVPKVSVRKSSVLLKSIETGEKILANRDTTYDINIKDVYLVFRALCKLSMKQIPQLEGATDLKSTNMRSKLLALHLVHTVLMSYMHVFFIASHILFSSESLQTSQILFIHAVKQYMCLTLSRNATSVVPQVFDIAIEIFGKVLTGLRWVLKKELSVIFTEIILPILEAKENITFHQRSTMMKTLNRVLTDPQSKGGIVLIQLYLNFDCDVESSAKENIWERTVNAVSKVMSIQYSEHHSLQLTLTSQSSFSQSISVGGYLPAMTTTNLTSFTREQVKELYSSSGNTTELKKRSLELLVHGLLKQLVLWYDSRIRADVQKSEAHPAEHIVSDSTDPDINKKYQNVLDNVSAFKSLKQKKRLLLEGIEKFNSEKPKNGIKFLLETGIIAEDKPIEIANFLLNTQGLNKKMIGEYLGDGDERNIQIMHSFVDLMDFANTRFVDALRLFLQSFRLPGEAQKIDRFMLKFAERYVGGNLQSFSSADTAYVLAYSVIMLNTDQHNTQVKKRMTKADFVKNNRGIDEGNDLPEEFLESIFDAISSNEIVLNDEQAQRALLKSRNETEGSLRNRRSSMAQVTIATEVMVMNTEARFNNIIKSKAAINKNSADKSIPLFLTATNIEHLKPMIQIVCGPILNGLVASLNESDDPEIIGIVLEGFRHAIYFTCLFELHAEQKTFVAALANMSMVKTIYEMKIKNLDSISLMLEFAYRYGNQFTDSWKDVISTIAQLERLQLLGSEGELEIQRIHRHSGELKNDNTAPKVEINTQQMSIAVDKIFTSSSKLNGVAIVNYVRALCEISLDEIMTSTDTDQPRMYCLQRLVEISYYNMNRIRVEWSNIWAILGEHFNKCGCHRNSNVAFFALDQLRQLAIKFLDIEELSNFKFQKDFLRPFEYVVSNNPDPKIKDMVLVCLQQMIQSKAKKMKSGWKAVFSAFSKAARESYDNISHLTFDIMKNIFKTNFESVVLNFTFSDFVNCLVEFCRNKKFVKTSLHAVEMIRQSIPRMAELSKWQQATNFKALQEFAPSTPLGSSLAIKPSLDEDPNYKFWFPILFGLYEIIMTSDLEVRTRALAYLFETIKMYGEVFPMDFWEVVAKGVVFPIFDDLRLSKQEHTKYANREDMSVWMSTTLIQALRNLVDLYAHFFAKLRFMTDGVLELLSRCMMQENETLARIGSTCLQELVESNIEKIDYEIWSKICDMFAQLFISTTPEELFFDTENSSSTTNRPRPEKKDFQRIIVKCVLHLLLIQTLNEILLPYITYQNIQTEHLLTLTDCLQQSFIFAHNFNANIELRTQLFRMGFMKQMPNLLKQETTSVSTFLTIYIRMYSDEQRIEYRPKVADILLPLMSDILSQYNMLDQETKKRDVNAWKPVAHTIIQAISEFEDKTFQETIHLFYGDITNMLLGDLTPEMKIVLLNIYQRCGILFKITKTEDKIVNGTTVSFQQEPKNECVYSIAVHKEIGVQGRIENDQVNLTREAVEDSLEIALENYKANDVHMENSDGVETQKLNPNNTDITPAHTPLNGKNPILSPTAGSELQISLERGESDNENLR